MKYPKITELVPANESFDESAVNEGVWLSEPHLSAIEKKTEEISAALTVSNTALETANASLATATEELNTLKATAKASETTISTQATRIAELEAQVAALGKNPSGTGSVVITKKDDTQESTVKPSYASESNPANEWLDKQMSRRKKTA